MIMHKYPYALLLVTVIFVLFCAKARGEDGREKAFLEQIQERDSVLIADQLRYGVELKQVSEGTSLAFPDWSKVFGEGVEMVAPWKMDTLKTKKGRKGQPSSYDIKAYVTLTSFEEGEYQLPPVMVARMTGGRADTLVFDPMVMDVRTIPIDTATFKPHDIKAQIRYPVTFREIAPYLALALGVAGLIALVVVLILRHRRKAAGRVAAEPAHIIALRKLERFRSEKMWEPQKQKAFYSGITDVLREYIANRYGISAVEMTTAEIFDRMQDTDAPKELVSQAEELFERADFVKFAKHVASDQENASAVPTAVRFVTGTYQAELEAEVESKR